MYDKMKGWRLVRSKSRCCWISYLGIFDVVGSTLVLVHMHLHDKVKRDGSGSKFKKGSILTP